MVDGITIGGKFYTLSVVMAVIGSVIILMLPVSLWAGAQQEEAQAALFPFSLESTIPLTLAPIEPQSEPPSQIVSGLRPPQMLATAAYFAMLTPEDGVHVYEVAIPQAGRFTIETEGTLDTHGALFDTDGRELLADDDSGDRENFRLSLNLTPGIYYIRVMPAAIIAHGQYLIFAILEQDEGDSIETATDLLLDTRTDAWLISRTDVDFFRMSVPDEGLVFIRARSEHSILGALYDQDGTLRYQDYYFPQAHLLPGGEYVLQVRAEFPLDMIPYGIEVEHLPAQTIDIPSLTSGHLGSTTTSQLYKMAVPSTGILYVESIGQTDLNGVLLDSRGEIVSQSGSVNANIRIDQTVAEGFYYLQVSGAQRSEYGPYQLNIVHNVDHGDTISTATQITIGRRLSAEIRPAYDDDIFQIATDREGFLVIESTSDISMGGRITDENDVTLAQSVSLLLTETSQRLRLLYYATAGDYWLHLFGVPAFSATGEYKMNVRQEIPQPIVSGDLIREEINSAGDIDFFVVEPTAVPFPPLDIRGTTTNIRVRYFDAQGNPATSPPNIGQRYFIGIEGATSTTTGSYTIRATRSRGN